jgi:hypothetical protein
MMSESKTISKNIFFMVLGSPTGAKRQAKNTPFQSEFDADSEYVILFQKFFGQKKWPYRYLSFLGYEMIVELRVA